MTSMYRTLNPTTEQIEQEFPTLHWPEIEPRLAQAHEAYMRWRSEPFSTRCKFFTELAENLRAQRDAYATLITTEMGKPITDARAEIEKCAWLCEYYAEHAATLLQPEVVVTDAQRSYVQFDPLGVIFGSMPWNFPFWQVVRCAVPALLVGNTFILKHAANVPQCANAIAQAFAQSGFPDGVFQSLFITHDDAARVIASPLIQGVSLTGSTNAGRTVAAVAGQHLKKTVLELGGSDPFIVLADADVQHAAQTAVRARMLNCGQSCIAAKRLIVVEKIAAAFTQAVHKAVSQLIVGDPMQAATQVGPLARNDLRDNLARQVDETCHQGATVLCGGAARPGPGFFYQPTVLTNVQSTMTACTEETFGPVAAIVVAKNEADAINLANATDYGLGASLWTQNLDRATALARDINAGCVFINALVKSDPRLPFGGVKHSGHGRELGTAGLREFANIKTVWVH